jgi:hypothetical protein
MKRELYNATLILLLSIPLTGILAQPEMGTSMKPILTDALSYIQTAEDKGFEIVRMEFDIISDTKSTYRTLIEGWTYAVIAFGDYRISDIDIAIYKDVDGTWTLIQKDNAEAANASVIIKPSSTGMYKIDILAYKFVPGYSAAHYGLLIIHE